MSKHDPRLIPPHRGRLMVIQEIISAIRCDVPLEIVLERLAPRFSYYSSNLNRLRAGMENGCSFAEAAAGCTRLFPIRYQPYLAAGTGPGQLLLMLERLAEDYAFERALIRPRYGAIIYPTLVFLLPMMFLLGAISQLEPIWMNLFALSGGSMYGDAGGISSILWLYSHAGWFILTFAVFVIAAFFTFPILSDQQWFHTFHEKIPVIGKSFKYCFWAKFSLALGQLVKGFEPLPEAIVQAGRITNRDCIAETCERIAADLKEGSSLADSLKKEGIFPETLVWAAAMGETSGDLSEALIHWGQSARKQGETMNLNAVQTWEVAFVSGVVLTVFVYIVPVYVPIFNIANLI